MPSNVETRGLGDVDRILEELKALQKSAVAVAAPGVHQPRSVSRARSGRKPRPYQRFASFSRRRVLIADLIRWHEFGLGVPPRRWIRTTLQSRRTEIDKSIETSVQRVIGTKARFTAKDAHDRVGKRVVAEMRRVLKGRLQPALSPATMRDPDRDRRGIPLLDTGQIRDSLEHRSEGLPS